MWVQIGRESYVLTLAGGLYIQRIVAGASSLYGSFATIIGLFAWIALLVQTLVYGTLVNVVRVERLWPRSLTGHRSPQEMIAPHGSAQAGCAPRRRRSRGDACSLTTPEVFSPSSSAVRCAGGHQPSIACGV